jgi:hypothetical protein
MFVATLKKKASGNNPSRQLTKVQLSIVSSSPIPFNYCNLTLDDSLSKEAR